MVWLYAISAAKGMVDTASATPVAHALAPLPQLIGRVAVLGGSSADKSQLLVSLALRQVRQQGVVLCLDGRRQKTTEVQFRLLLRGAQSYMALPPSGEAPPEVERMALSMLSRGLPKQPALLLLDAVHETPAWERTLAFLLKAGVVIVELLTEASELVFGRYDSVLLLRADQNAAEAYSKAVGRRVSPQDIYTLPPGEGILIHLTRVQRVRAPAVHE